MEKSGQYIEISNITLCLYKKNQIAFISKNLWSSNIVDKKGMFRIEHIKLTISIFDVSKLVSLHAHILHVQKDQSIYIVSRNPKAIFLVSFTVVFLFVFC